jgi:hypothetical protein
VCPLTLVNVTSVYPVVLIRVTPCVSLIHDRDPSSLGKI